MMSQPASASHQGLLHQHLDGLVVEDGAVAHQAVMAVAGVGIERDVAEDADLRHLLLDGADGAADQIVRIERLAAVLVAQRSGRYRETARCRGWRAWRLVRRRARPDRRKAARRRAWRRPARASSAVDQEQRPDQVVGGEHMLAHQAPRPFGLAVAARAGGEVEARRGLARVLASTGARRASIGRPYLMAIAALQAGNDPF